ncbi:hypothetical protein [Allobaculum mucilyticum]|uniref:hypothetical protein n=1 Tax=Allobaculum mucilyticum TaxID=2834459 RepID=UPI001E5B555A|nr:hypothetical protein [Allobaculum mucilyticum]UNT95560.1 hypothetical protein KWG62_09540 [Allobaculum mucilyticum]
MYDEEQFLDSYRAKMDQISLSSDQKQTILSAMKKERDIQAKESSRKAADHYRSIFSFPAWKLALASGLVLAAAVLIVFSSFHGNSPSIAPDPAADTDQTSLTADLVLLPDPEANSSAPHAVGGLGSIGWYKQTINPDAEKPWPRTLPVYEYNQIVEGRRVDPYNQNLMQKKLVELAGALNIDAKWIIGEVDPYLMNSSIWADTPWGRLDLVNADEGELFVNGAIAFDASTPDEALKQVETVIETYTNLFPLGNPVIEAIPVRTTDPQNAFTFILYEENETADSKIHAIKASPITIYCTDEGIQTIVYPLNSTREGTDYPVLSKEEAIETFQTPQGYEEPEENRIWVVWKNDPTDTWKMPYYRFYLKNETYGGYEAFDLCAICPEYFEHDQ